MAAKVEQYIPEYCKMQQSFRCILMNKEFCANRIFRSVSTIYCSFHSASHSCGSDEGSLQPSLWLPKLSSILQKLAKCSTSLHGPMGVVPIDFFYSVSAIYCSFHSASHSCGSDEGSLQPSLWLPKLSSILKKLPRCSTSLHGHLEVVPIVFLTQFLQYTALFTQPATHVAVMMEAYSHHYGCQS